MIEQGTIITVCSSMITGIAVIVSNVWMTKSNVQNLKESLTEFKATIKETIKTEKDHALELGRTRIVAVEKDVSEIFPRLRSAEDAGQKNCIVLSKLLKDHDRLVCLREGKEQNHD